ncbi:hypothetical protein KKH23_09310 [Patescibacteria group bacterium]|nr:hypothetical protein [Patescibacteria group bacterium]MBU0847366.1 hypothetical protein [Patescibacteria group bacterium]
MLELKPISEATVGATLPKLLQEGYYVRFTDQWPLTLPHVKGKTFQVEKTNQVPYDITRIIPGGNYTDVDMSNATGGENIYPENTKTLYETILGFKPGNYLVHFYIPAGEYVHRLEQAGMVPNVASATLRYLGARKPEDSPYDDKRIFTYSVKDLEPLILRLLVDNGVAWEKMVLGLVVNKCYLKQITPTAEQLARAKVVRYYPELRW